MGPRVGRLWRRGGVQVCITDDKYEAYNNQDDITLIVFMVPSL